MRRLTQALLLVCTATLTSAALAFDNGQYEDVPPHIRSWFKNVLAPNGVPCCDISDGHRTDYDVRSDGYWVPIDGQWMPVPQEAIVQNAGNPVGEAVVWYSHYNERVFIRCFVPGGGV